MENLLPHHYNNAIFDKPSQLSILKTNCQPDTGQFSILLYQGAVNIGRGIREMIDVLQILSDCRLVVAGDGDVLEQMKQYAAARPWHDRVEFLGRVQPDRLRALTAQASLGLCLLEDLGLNYRYSLPNQVCLFWPPTSPKSAVSWRSTAPASSSSRCPPKRKAMTTRSISSAWPKPSEPPCAIGASCPQKSGVAVSPGQGRNSTGSTSIKNSSPPYIAPADPPSNLRRRPW